MKHNHRHKKELGVDFRVIHPVWESNLGPPTSESRSLATELSVPLSQKGPFLSPYLMMSSACVVGWRSIWRQANLFRGRHSPAQNHYGQSHQHYECQRVWLKHNLNLLRGGIPRPIGNFPESSSQAILVGIMLVGRSGVPVSSPALACSQPSLSQHSNGYSLLGGAVGEGCSGWG